MQDYAKKIRPWLRRSAIWKMPDDEFSALVENSLGVGQVLEKFSLENKGRNHVTVRARIKELNISTKHFDKSYRLKRSDVIPLEKVMTKNSYYSVGALKRRLLKENILKNVCYICGLLPIWNNKPITLRIDHINGDKHDARLDNLRILCPNCDSQQDTYCGKKSAILRGGVIGSTKDFESLDSGSMPDP